jgi:excisionase family DNA binding protein
MEAFLTIEELYKILKVTSVWLYKLVREKRIPFYHVEKCIRFSPSEIEQWLQERKDRAWHQDKN